MAKAFRILFHMWNDDVDVQGWRSKKYLTEWKR